ncbi:hypothetical protein FNV43_RR16626 [Rhamnella rubrinervis]|uniref:RRM domain-containing protein n=1 Tax=Rhamnella rubrinervis TaxID=2594499 RepID=A0A8K0GZ45_9ROSA|nr:hypothetical protein FNV43_RR16626 [Rhamnella rubrinervis]
MTIDDESSIYVGGLPYDSTEDSVRRVFDLYGAVVAVKIINDHGTRGKCYGFVTFTNPRSAIDAINDMDGRGRDWDRGRDRDRERDYDQGKVRYQHHSDRSRERDRSQDRDHEKELEYEYAYNHDQARNHALDEDRDLDRNLEDIERDHRRNLDRGWEENVIWTLIEIGKWMEPTVAIILLTWIEISCQGNGMVLVMLTDMISLMEERLKREDSHVLDLQKKSKKLEDALINAKKNSSYRQMQLTKLHKCYLQVKDYSGRLKSCEQELQSLVDSVVMEDIGHDDVSVWGGILTNGKG